MRLETYIELEIEVDYDYYPASRGHRDSYGVPLEPDEPASIEINSVMFGSLELFGHLSEQQIKSLKEVCLEGFIAEPHPDY